MAWKLYLRSVRQKKIPSYASPSRCRDYRGLPPAYTFVGDAEPFYCETLTYIENLRKAGIPAAVDVYPGMYHAFDMMEPDSVSGRTAAERFLAAFKDAVKHCYAEN